MARTFPAVLVRGIIESGKTTFINDSLKNGDFGDVGRVLILATEEGEVEMFAPLYPLKPKNYEEYAENVNEAIKKRNQKMRSA